MEATVLGKIAVTTEIRRAFGIDSHKFGLSQLPVFNHEILLGYFQFPNLLR
jgi:hypothetical protein